MLSLVEKLWYQPSWTRYLVAPVLWPLSLLFGAVSKRRRTRFLTTPSLCFRAPVPVIVVGNISVGGNGKTPMVLWLVEKLQAQGMTPGVISRGYGGKASHYPLLLTMDSSTDEAGDEPVLIYQRTGAPVAVSANRADAITALLPLGVDIIISDDGLQHYRLARDLEIAVIDGQRRFGNGHYLPYGPLRELPARLHELDLVICNGDSPYDNEMHMRLEPSQLVNLLTGERCYPETLEQVIAIAGIGHPERFFTTLQQLNVTMSQRIPFADHQAFSEAQLAGLAQQGTPLVMTEKDAVKCRQFVQTRQLRHWWYLPVDAQFSHQDTQYILHKIHEIKEGYGPSSA